HAPRHVHHYSLTQLDFLVIQLHPSLSVDDIIDLIRALVVMQLRIRYFQMVHLRRRAITLLDHRPDESARFVPRFHIRWITPKVRLCLGHNWLLHSNPFTATPFIHSLPSATLPNPVSV